MLENEVLELVKKHLPEQVSGIFKEFVVESQRVKDERDSYSQQLVRSKEEIESLKRRLNESLSKIDFLEKEAQQVRIRELEVQKSEKAVLHRELRQDIAELKAQEAERRADTIKDLVSIVFRNPRFVTNESRTYPVEKKQYSTYYENGIQKMVESSKYDSTETETKTTTQEQE